MNDLKEEIAQRNKEREEFIMRQLALEHAIASNAGTSAKHIVEIAETFYEFLSAEKEKP